MKTIIHVSSDAILKNKKGGKNAILKITTEGQILHSDSAIIYGQDGKEAARVVYRPDNPLPCGAKAWIETSGMVEVGS